MIKEQKTIEKYGYEVSKLAPTSNKKVVWACDKCGTEKDFTHVYAKRKEEKAKKEGKMELCQKCAHAHRRGKKNPRHKERSPNALPPEINESKTLEMFGYIASELKPWSRKKVVLNCYETGKECITRRASLNLNKSVSETGHFISTGAYTKKRRSGKKASEETKAKMRKAQQARREKERKLEKIKREKAGIKSEVSDSLFST